MQTKGNNLDQFDLSSSLLVVGPESEWDFDNDQIFSNKHLNNTRNFNESEFGSLDFFQKDGSVSIPTLVLDEDSDNSNRSSPTDSVAERYFLEFEAQKKFNRSNQNNQISESFNRQPNGFQQHQQVARQQQHSFSNDFQQQNQDQYALQKQYGQPYGQQSISKPRLQPTPHQMQYRQTQQQNLPQNNLNGGYYQQQQQSLPRNQQQQPLVITPEYQKVMAKYQVPPSQYPIKGAVLSAKTSIPEPVYGGGGGGRGGGGANNKQSFQTQQQQQFGSGLFQKQGELSALSFPPIVNDDSIVYMVSLILYQFVWAFSHFLSLI
jgi:hypothetical protein